MIRCNVTLLLRNFSESNTRKVNDSPLQLKFYFQNLRRRNKHAFFLLFLLEFTTFQNFQNNLEKGERARIHTPSHQKSAPVPSPFSRIGCETIGGPSPDFVAISRKTWSRVVSPRCCYATARGRRCLKRLRIAVLVFHPFPCSWYAHPPPSPRSCTPFRASPPGTGVVNDIMESRSTSSPPPPSSSLPPSLWPTSAVQRDVTNHASIFLSLPLPPSSIPPSLSFSPRHLCYPVFLLRSVKRAETSRRSFFFYRTFRRPLLLLIPYSPIFIRISFRFQRERDRDNLITARCCYSCCWNCNCYHSYVCCDDMLLCITIGSLSLQSLFVRSFVCFLLLVLPLF